MPNFANVTKQFPAKDQYSFILSQWNSIVTWAKLNQDSINNCNLLNSAAALFTHSVANLAQLYINSNQLHCGSKMIHLFMESLKKKTHKYQLPLYQMHFCLLVCVPIFFFREHCWRWRVVLCLRGKHSWQQLRLVSPHQLVLLLFLLLFLSHTQHNHSSGLTKWIWCSQGCFKVTCTGTSSCCYSNTTEHMSNLCISS